MITPSEEKFALNVLNKVCGVDISNFIKGESPDWQNEIQSIGIEITIEDDSIKFFSELENFDVDKIKDKDKFRKRYIENGGYAIPKETAQILNITHSQIDIGDDYIYLTYSDKDNFDKVNIRIKQKLDKLNKNFKVYEHNWLIVFTPTYATNEMLYEELQELNLICKKYQHTYSIIYMIFGEAMTEFNLKENKFRNTTLRISDFI